MNYFVVFQNQTYREERKGQYLWAPQKNKAGRTQFYWESMKDARPGDIVFSMYKQHLQSVNTVTQSAVEAENPFAGNELWGRRGWLVKVSYYELKIPVSMKSYQEDIIKLSPPKYSPFTKTGSGNQGYLYPIDQDFGEFLLNLAKKYNGGRVLNN